MGGNPPLLLTDSDVDALAREFLRSRYLGPIYADWSPDRRRTPSFGGVVFPVLPTTAISPWSSWIASWST